MPPPPAPSWETKDAAPGQDAVLPENAGPEDDLAELDTAALLRKLSGEVDEGEANADEISESGESRTEQSRTGTNRADGTS